MSADPNQQDLANREFENIIPGISPGIRNLQMRGFQQVTLVDGQVFPVMAGYVQMGPSPINTYNNQQLPPGVIPLINPVVIGGPTGGVFEFGPGGPEGVGEDRHAQVDGQCIPDPDGMFLNLAECQEAGGDQNTDEEGVVIGGGGGGGGGAPPTIHARLTQKSTSSSPSFSGHSLWDWKEVFIKNQGSTFFFDVDEPTSKSSFQYGSFPNGRAIELQGSSVPGDIVELTPVEGLDGKSWFTFIGREHPPIVLKLSDGEISPSGNYEYSAIPQQWDPVNARFDLHPYYKGGTATNLCRAIFFDGVLLRDSYGQTMTFEKGQLVLGDPITNGAFVIGMLRNVTAQGEWEYVFSERLNVEPVCEESAP